MKRSFSVGVASLSLLLLVLLWWFARMAFVQDDVMGGLRSDSRTSPEREVLETDVMPVPQLEVDRVELVPEVEAAEVVPEEPIAEEATPAPPDLEARDWLEILVVDDQQLPVPDAEVTIRGLRSHSNRGSWFGFRGELPIQRTDHEGRVRISYWTWVNIDGRSSAVDLYVSHAEFVSFNDSAFRVGPGVHTVELRRGAMVVISGWIGARDNIVTDLSIQLDQDCGLDPDSWQRGLDGKPYCTSIPPGPHLIWLEHESVAFGNCSSEIETFEVKEDDFLELNIELHPGETLTGVIDHRVPRPVLDGNVRLSVQRGGLSYDDPSIYREFETTIQADGSFSFAQLPRGRGQIFALCQGWVSQRTLADSALEAGIHLSEPVSKERELKAIKGIGDRAFQMQRITIPPPAGTYTILMEPTGILEIEVKLQDGTPVAGASAAVSPNIQTVGIGASIAPWREWRVVTDHEGRGRIVDLPRDTSLSVGARHDDYQVLKSGRRRSVWVEVRPGETSRVEVIMEPKNQ